MLNPLHMTRFTDLLHQGSIMGQVYQPFEAHLQFLLQWMCDFNLYGCSYIDCKVLKFRGPVPDAMDIDTDRHQWHDQSIDPESILDPARYPRQSHCAIEVDICVKDILNRFEIQHRDLHANFEERFNPSPDTKLVQSLAGLWRDETRRRKLRMGLTDPSSSPFPPEVLISMSADPRSTEKGGWIHEEEFRQLVDELVHDEKDKTGVQKVTFDDFVKPSPVESTIQTVLESVQDLFPENLQRYSAHEKDFSAYDYLDQHVTNAVVPEHKIPDFDGDDFPSYESDEEKARTIALTQRRPEDTSHVQKTNDILIDGQQAISAPQDVEAAEAVAEQISFGDTDLSGESVVAKDLGDAPEDASEINHFTSTLKDSVSRLSKRRKVSHDEKGNNPTSPLDDLKTLRTRKVGFADEATPFQALSSQRSRSPKKIDQDGLSGSQLSQRSIKANDVTSSPYTSFPVVKNPYKRGAPSPERNKVSSTAPTIPKVRTQAATMTPATPWTAKTSTARTPRTPAAAPSPALLQLGKALDAEFRGSRNVCLFNELPPRSDLVMATMIEYGRPQVVYQDAYYSEEKDVPERARDYAGREFKLESTTVPFLPEFDPEAESPASYGMKPGIVIDTAKQELQYRRKRETCNLRVWDYAAMPPSRACVEEWAQKEAAKVSVQRRMPKHDRKEETAGTARKRGGNLSQVEGPTQRNKHGFKYSQKKASTSVKHETQYMSTMSLEIHVNTRDNLVPNPELDEVQCIFWCLKSDDVDVEKNNLVSGTRVGILVLSESEDFSKRLANESGASVETETTELDLLNRLVDIVREFDPDVLTGYEVHNGSWGYLIERGRIKYEFDLCDEFSRMKSQSHGRFGKEADRWGFNHTSTIRVTGRHMINIWRAMRSELNLLQYTMENVAFHLLHKRIPHYPFRDLTTWYGSKAPRDLAKVVQYFLGRAQVDIEILDANELIPRTSEQARLIGVDFFSVFSRGSQFKVESFMFRIAKPENFLLVSPSRKQVGQQNALECLPLVMEPQSAYYNSPLLVLDFQSLYPSIMIAYNYCYSTCLGRIVSWRGQNKLGFADFKRQARLLELVKDSINIAPNGLMFVKPEMRKSLLAKMLGEILETRVMVKSGMKVDKDDKTLQQLLNNRQLALKLLANVTYGYTSASFSGRMPCSEIADSIVQTGRETLEKAIALIHSVTRWGAEVVYGDTDSLFVHLKGRTKDDAFRIGNEIAKAVTDLNPRPIKLKFEKVYFPCVLLAKKRYVGFKYESPSQVEPDFDAKGIETVRRDGTPAEQKIEETALKMLFRTSDLSQIKKHFQTQAAKIMLGTVSIQDFCFAREVKLGTYADKGPPPPGALISTRKMLEDPRLEPQYGERVPYVVVTGAPGARLIDRCVAPEQLLRDESLELDAEYYISKNLIPPLERIFNLVGANVRAWFDEMPKVQRVRDAEFDWDDEGEERKQYAPNGQLVPVKKTLEGYLKSSNCVVCRAKLPPAPPSTEVTTIIPLCTTCLADPAQALLVLRTKLRAAQQKAAGLETICRSCSGLSWAEEVKCDSKDCPVFYSRVRGRAKERRVRRLVEGVGRVLERGMEW
jgi:DNA polymerase zeta